MSTALRRALVAMFAIAPLALQAQSRCIIEGAHQKNIQLASGQYNSFFGGGVFARCPAKQLTLQADSLESYGDEGRIYFRGSVRYNEPRLALTSDDLTYYQRDDRAVARGHVNGMLPNGSTLVGPTAEYFRAIPNVRPAPKLIAVGRPTITIVQRDSAGKTTEPMTVIANNVYMIGDSVVYAGGQVQVDRTDIRARGDSMELDSQRELMYMLLTPSIEGRRERPFKLSGDRIELTSKNKKLQRVLSRGKGSASSEDMTLSSDTIDLRVRDDLLQRAIAWGPGRARALSQSQRITADSIDVLMPQQRVSEMHAVRRALAEGKTDSTRFRADTLNWLRGDTIVARFDTMPSTKGDTARTTRIRELTAHGNAKSYYHLAPADSSMRRPAINYVSGREIIVGFQDQVVSKVTVIQKAYGVYLEPKTDTTRRSGTRPASPAVPSTRPASPAAPIARPATPPATRPAPTKPR